MNILVDQHGQEVCNNPQLGPVLHWLVNHHPEIMIANWRPVERFGQVASVWTILLHGDDTVVVHPNYHILTGLNSLAGIMSCEIARALWKDWN